MRNEIEVKRTAHFYTINQDQEVSEVLYVIHGYAQLASEFIKQFEFLKGTKTLVVAPEGLSKFYGKDRTPVSSWMTSHERDSEINDYINYLNSIHTFLKSNHQIQKIKLLGFSQGTSTIFRWLNQLKERNIDLHICSGSIPPELGPENKLLEKLNKTNFYYGDQDRLMKKEQAETAIKKLDELNIQYSAKYFSGRHEINEITHKELLT